MVQDLTDAGWEVQDQKMALGMLELLIFLPLQSLVFGQITSLRASQSSDHKPLL